MDRDAANPFAMPVDVRSIPPKGATVRIAPSEDERAAIAREVGLLRLDRLDGELTVSRWRGEGVVVEGTLHADVVQPCSVSLDPVPSTLAIPVEATYMPEGSVSGSDEISELLLDPEAEDAPEPFDGSTIDAGALAVEFLVLSLDPYPRAEGASLPEEAAETGPAGPFAALGALKAGS